MIFILVAGFGFGNASRQLAIIKELRSRSPDLPISVISWGQGAVFLKNESRSLHFKLFTLPHWKLNLQSSYAISMFFTTLVYLLQYPVHIFLLLLWRLKYCPQIVVFDSDYHFPAFIFSHARRISINQSPRILYRSQSYSFFYLLKNGYFFSYIVEKIDFYFQLIFVHKILAPSFAPQDIKVHRWDKVLPIPLIVRQEFNVSKEVSDSASKPALVLGGSGLESKDLKSWAAHAGVRVFEKNLNGTSAPENLADQLRDFNPLVMQGGLSSLSEGIALKKFLVILPIENHWEQYLNGQEVSDLGFGQVTTIQNLNAVLSSSSKMTAMSLKTPDCSGAFFVADYLLKELSHET